MDDTKHRNYTNMNDNNKKRKVMVGSRNREQPLNTNLDSGIDDEIKESCYLGSKIPRDERSKVITSKKLSLR